MTIGKIPFDHSGVLEIKFILHYSVRHRPPPHMKFVDFYF